MGLNDVIISLDVSTEKYKSLSEANTEKCKRSEASTVECKRSEATRDLIALSLSCLLVDHLAL